MFLQISCIFGPKNLPKTLPKRAPNPSKIDAENVLLFNVDFFMFRPRFGRVLGPQVRRAACSARRVKSYSMDMCLEPPCMEILGEARRFQIRGPPGLMLAPCWHYVGISGAFFACVRFLHAFWPILDVFFGFLVALDSILQALGQVLEPSNLYFSIFCGVSQHNSQKCSSCNKTTIFAMFYRICNMSHTATERVFFIAFRAWLDMVHGLLPKIPAGIHFLLFATTLQRGGTCEAH